MTAGRIADRLLVAGVGLIGGSLAMALKARGVVGEVVGLGRSAENLRVARRRGLIDRAERDPVRAAQGVDFVVVAVPVQATAPLIAALMPALAPEAIITDAGSVKGSVVVASERILGRTAGRFCGSHPIAGTEHSGAAAALPDLLTNQRCILTPTRHTAPATIRRVRALWRAAGMRVEEMPPATHDRVLALVSHLPHVVAACLVNAVADAGRASRALAYAAGGFRDTTRIAGSSAEMWRDIFVANRTEVVDAIDRFGGALERLRDAIVRRDHAAIEAELIRARTARRGVVVRPGARVRCRRPPRAERT